MELQFHYREELQIGHRNNQLYVTIQHAPVDPPAYAIVRTIDPFLTKQLEMLGTASTILLSLRESLTIKPKHINT